MGGGWVVRKPSRSDEVLDAEQQLRITDQIRAHFDSLNPKRPPKPNRSETDSDSSHQHLDLSDDIPELTKFKFLSSLSQQQQQLIFPEGGVLRAVEEEFVETHYYNKLNSIDKQHHTTGTGFIRVSEGSGDGYELQLQLKSQEGGGKGEMVFRSNPATNDWT